MGKKIKWLWQELCLYRPGDRVAGSSVGIHPGGDQVFLWVLLYCSAFLCYLLPEDEVGNWHTGTPAPSPFPTHGFLALRDCD